MAEGTVEKKPWIEALGATFHPLARWVNRLERIRRRRPFICVITPVFDPAQEALILLVNGLRQQSLGNFIHVMVSNGPSPAVREFVERETAGDDRFIYDEIPEEAITGVESLISNLGSRRRHALGKYQASRYVFLDADVRLLDNDYFAKLYLAHRLSGNDVILTGSRNYERHLPAFPIRLGNIDMSNYSFSAAAARAHPYPDNLSPEYGIANDYRYYEQLTADSPPLHLDFLAAEKDGNRGYRRVTDMYIEKEEQFRFGGGGNLIPVFGNCFGEADRAALEEVLDSHLVGAGAATATFEKRFRETIGFDHAVALNSATTAFWLLIRALGLGEGDEVIVPNIHFHGVANALKVEGVTCRVCDVDAGAPVLTLESVREHINDNTRAIVGLDYGGWPIDIAPVREHLASLGREDIVLILDAANSPLTSVDGEYAARQYDYAFYSFDMNKIIVTGEGGMLLSDDGDTVDRVRAFACHGIAGSVTSYERARGGDGSWWEVQIGQPGLKFTLSNIAGSLGVTQLGQAQEFLRRRRELRDHYLRQLAPLVGAGRLTLPPVTEAVEGDLYLFWIRAADQQTRDALARYLLAKKIYTTVKYQPLDGDAATPNAHDFWARSLCLPMHQNVVLMEADYIAAQIEQFYAEREGGQENG